MFCLGAGAEHSDSLLVQQLFSSVGYCARVMEAQIGELTQCNATNGEGDCAVIYFLQQ